MAEMCLDGPGEDDGDLIKAQAKVTHLIRYDTQQPLVHVFGAYICGPVLKSKLLACAKVKDSIRKRARGKQPDSVAAVPKPKGKPGRKPKNPPPAKAEAGSTPGDAPANPSSGSDGKDASTVDSPKDESKTGENGEKPEPEVPAASPNKRPLKKTKKQTTDKTTAEADTAVQKKAWAEKDRHIHA